jgi:hypothetical protein
MPRHIAARRVEPGVNDRAFHHVLDPGTVRRLDKIPLLFDLP